ncbi:M3 family metallopeptidase [Marinoscillum sp. MHG1-6]|uniref:M3 family metallopeptidase n=1 Tax=Marinoscillum sp. MHG1-6 TaxID=2959627 RepID=UPI00215873C8|nr:M3 family metallopeptidase [Marinoscillum sp. MHG1-6]
MKNSIFAPFISLIILFSCTENKQPVDNYQLPENQPTAYANIDVDSLNEIMSALKSLYKNTVEEIKPIEGRTFENTIWPLERLSNVASKSWGVFSILANAHPDSLIRTTASQLEVELGKLSNEISLDEDIYQAYKAYSETEEAKKLSPARSKLVADQMRDYAKNGFNLSKEKRDYLKLMLDAITETGNTFQKNIAMYSDFAIFTEEEMEGTTEDFKKSHLQEDGTYKVGLSYPDFIPFMENASSDAARKELYVKFLNRAADSNLPVLATLIEQRDAMAKHLDYTTYASYELDGKMAKNPKTVWEFEFDLEKNVRPKGDADYAELVEMQKELGMSGEEVAYYNVYYLKNQLLQTSYGVDQEEVRQYFELENVKSGLFQITQKLFGLTYKEIENASVWHEDVTAYEVFEGPNYVGRFYLDLHPRENKFTHAACWPLRPSMALSSGNQTPEAALLCNFTKPTPDKPALLTHSEVETFFHEFGHVLHNILSTTELPSQSGTRVSRDFVEAPSQIFENWVWNYEALALFAKHYKTGEILPKELFDKMYAAQNLQSGLETLRQVIYGQYALTLYDGFDPDGDTTTTELFHILMERISPFSRVEGTHFEAAFGHLYGYGSSYYGYLWSLVFAQDMFSRFEKEGILNPEVGKAYRNAILSKGGSVQEMDMLKEFLGRAPNQDAFIKSIGLEL